MIAVFRRLCVVAFVSGFVIGWECPVQADELAVACLGLHEAAGIYPPNICLTPDDGMPVGQRTPVILIHGWSREGYSDGTQWFSFFDYFYQLQWFKDNCKIFTLEYNSNEVSIKELGRFFAQLVAIADQKYPGFNGKPLIIVAHSMGGLVARSFMEETRSNGDRGDLNGERVLQLITLGTPHHGTPVANGPARDVKAGTFVGWLISIFDYGFWGDDMSWATDNRIDLHWDNYDNFLDYKRFPQEDNIWLRHLNEYASYDWKITSYGGNVPAVESLQDCFEFSLGCAALAFRLALSSAAFDGVVPYSSASYENCNGCGSALFGGLDHYELIDFDKTPALGFWISRDIHNAIFGW